MNATENDTQPNNSISDNSQSEFNNDTTDSLSHKHIVQQTAVSHVILHDILGPISHGIFFRLDSFHRPLEVLGVSGGDEEKVIEKGVWIKGLRSLSTQQSRATDPGFKNAQSGGMIGFDAEISEGLVLGGAYTNVYSDTKFTGISSIFNQQKTKIHVFTLYNERSMPNNFSVRSHLKYGRALIYANNSGVSVIKSKTHGDIWRASTECVYRTAYQNGVNIIPKLGTTFDYFTINKFSSFYNNTPANVSGRSGRRFAINGGIGIKKAIATKKDIQLIPEMHFNIDQAIYTKNGSAMVSTLGDHKLELLATTAKSSKTTYNVGTSVHINRNRKVDFGIGYDYSFRPQFKNHTGYLSVAIKF